MTKRIYRFKLCDLRFHPYLREVIERCLEEVNKLGFVESGNDKIPDSLSTRKGMITGILAAVKEANL